MLAHAMGPQYTFCHSGFSVRCPGNEGAAFHQDFAYGPAPYSSPHDFATLHGRTWRTCLGGGMGRRWLTNQPSRAQHDRSPNKQNIHHN